MRPCEIFALAVLPIAFTSCQASQPVVHSPSAQTVRPLVLQTNNGAQFIEFTVPTANSAPTGLAVGRGLLWFTEAAANKIAAVDYTGSFAEYDIPTPNSKPGGVAFGGVVWFTERNTGKIGYLSPPNTFVEFALPNPNCDPTSITVGPDPRLWFTETKTSLIGSIDQKGRVTEYPTLTPNSGPIGIVKASDGAMWFTESTGGHIGRITTAGVITEYPSTNSQLIAESFKHISWFTDPVGNNISSITSAGQVSAFHISSPAMPWGIAIDRSTQNPWFTEISSNSLQYYDTTARKFGPQFVIPSPSSEPRQIVSAQDGNLWFTEQNSNKIGVFIIQRLVTIPSNLSFGSPGTSQQFNVVESNYNGTFSATSSNTSVATVTPLPGSVGFSVAAVGAGTCKIRVSDKMLNTTKVSVVVAGK